MAIIFHWQFIVGRAGYFFIVHSTSQGRITDYQVHCVFQTCPSYFTNYAHVQLNTTQELTYQQIHSIWGRRGIRLPSFELCNEASSVQVDHLRIKHDHDTLLACRCRVLSKEQLMVG